jgi:hypothetical protein
MIIRRTFRAAGVGGCLLIVVSCSKNEGTHNGGVDGPKFLDNGAFFTLLRSTHSNYIPMSAEELARSSSYIGTGTVAAVREGMSICSKSSQTGSCLRTVVMEIHAQSTVKGTAPNNVVHVEYLHGGAFSAKTYDINKPKDALTLFLTAAAWSSSESEELVDEGKGYPADATLYRLTTPQGLFVTSDGPVEQPLERGQALFGPASTLAEIEEAARRLEEEDTSSSVSPEGTGGSNAP